jgi:hypothetical protein
MELLKVFVGDASGVATSVAGMVPGDLLLLDAADYSILKANTANLTTKDVIIAACVSKNGVNTPVFSTPIKKSNIKYITTAQDNESTVAEKQSTVVIDATKLDAGVTYTLGVQIKEDLRMGTYNKNTEILASHVCPPLAASTVAEVGSTLARGFSANPLSSAGSPYQIVSVVREAAGGTAMTALPASAIVTRGSREVSCAAHALVPGDIVNLGGNVYLVDGSRSANLFTLDTAYQGASGTLAAGTTSGANAAGKMNSTQLGNVRFRFTGVTQTQKNRYDQYRMVDFEVITPKGNDEGIFTITDVASTPIYPIGSFRQIRDLEEKAHTNIMPVINYREFPFEVFPVNATPGTFYCMLTVVYASGWGYNMMQSNQAEFLQTAVVAAPFAADGQFDNTQTTANQGSFLETWAAWATGISVGGHGSYAFS